jgi:hypothetical protein
MDVSLWLYQIIHFSRKWNPRMYLNVQREVAIAISPLAFKMPYFESVVKRNSRAQVRTTRRIAKNRFLPIQRGDGSLFSCG